METQSQIFADDAPLAPIRDLRRIDGRLSYHYEPDFCGRMNVVLDGRSPDRVTFHCEAELAADRIYVLRDSQAQKIRLRITAVCERRYTATIVDD